MGDGLSTLQPAISAFGVGLIFVMIITLMLIITQINSTIAASDTLQTALAPTASSIGQPLSPSSPNAAPTQIVFEEILRPTNIDKNGSSHLYLILTRDERGFGAEIQLPLPLIASYKNGSLSFNETFANQVIFDQRAQLLQAGSLHHWFFAFSNFKHFPQNITAGLYDFLKLKNNTDTNNSNSAIIKPLAIKLTELPQRFYEINRSSIPTDNKPHLPLLAVRWSELNIDYYAIMVSRSNDFFYMD